MKKLEKFIYKLNFKIVNDQKNHKKNKNKNKNKNVKLLILVFFMLNNIYKKEKIEKK